MGSAPQMVPQATRRYVPPTPGIGRAERLGLVIRRRRRRVWQAPMRSHRAHPANRGRFPTPQNRKPLSPRRASSHFPPRTRPSFLSADYRIAIPRSANSDSACGCTLTGGLRSGGMGCQPLAAKMVEQDLGEDRARRIAGTEDENVHTATEYDRCVTEICQVGSCRCLLLEPPNIGHVADPVPVDLRRCGFFQLFHMGQPRHW